ncbi:hypothetical protein [Rhodocaloribacter sp.]
MSSSLRGLFDRLEKLLVKSFRLTANEVGMDEREEVDWNLFLLVREIADHHDLPEPYWAEGKATAKKPGEASRPAGDRPPEAPASDRAATPGERRSASEEDGA